MKQFFFSLHLTVILGVCTCHIDDDDWATGIFPTPYLSIFIQLVSCLISAKPLLVPFSLMYSVVL